MDENSSAALWAAMGAAFTAVAAAITAGIVKIRQQWSKDDADVDLRIIEGYKVAIAELKASTNARIVALETAYGAMMNHHAECQRELAAVKQELSLVKSELLKITKGNA